MFVPLRVSTWGLPNSTSWTVACCSHLRVAVQFPTVLEHKALLGERAAPFRFFREYFVRHDLRWKRRSGEGREHGVVNFQCESWRMY